MTKPDWAERKAQAFVDKWAIDDWKRPAIAKLLRAERSRAVRVCKRIKKDNDHNIEGYDSPYDLACDDCAQAIAAVKGEK